MRAENIEPEKSGLNLAYAFQAYAGTYTSSGVMNRRHFFMIKMYRG